MAGSDSEWYLAGWVCSLPHTWGLIKGIEIVCRSGKHSRDTTDGAKVQSVNEGRLRSRPVGRSCWPRDTGDVFQLDRLGRRTARVTLGERLLGCFRSLGQPG